jgi:hypothetical protein
VLGSSLKGQSSYAHMSNPILGLSVIEKYTHYLTDRCQRNDPSYLDQSVRSIMVEGGYTKQRLGNAELGLWDALCEPNMTVVPMKHFWQQKKQQRQSSSSSDETSDYSNIQALTPLPKGIVQIAVSLPEEVVEKDALVITEETGNTSRLRDDGECNDDLEPKSTQRLNAVVEPTSVSFLMLVFGLMTCVAIGSFYL